MSKIYIYGKHAVSEALDHARGSVLKILMSGRVDDPAFFKKVKASGVPLGDIDPRVLSSQVEGRGTHQGVVALISLATIAIPFEHFAEKLAPMPDTLLVLLSEVQDPHNVGAIIRSAAAFGATAVLMPINKQSPITGAVVKASVGTAFRIPLVTMPNMQQAIATLKKKGFRVHGLAGDGTCDVSDEPFDAPALVILGNEAEGIAPSARALCDQILSIPIDSRAESLNVAAAGAVVLYAWSQKHTAKRAVIK
ncbi:MAG: 23S rRNA (guanosine(2251)-2'-O)-methyltransferase RlmB [Patescibacteria group bacterium]